MRNNTDSADPTSELPDVGPAAKRRSYTGIIPGSMRGQRNSFERQENPDERMHALTKRMSGAELAHWLKQGTNRKQYDDYLRRKNGH